MKQIKEWALGIIGIIVIIFFIYMLIDVWLSDKGGYDRLPPDAGIEYPEKSIF